MGVSGVGFLRGLEGREKWDGWWSVGSLYVAGIRGEPVGKAFYTIFQGWLFCLGVCLGRVRGRMGEGIRLASRMFS